MKINEQPVNIATKIANNPRRRLFVMVLVMEEGRSGLLTFGMVQFGENGIIVRLGMKTILLRLVMLVVGIVVIVHGGRGLMLVYGGGETLATVSHIEISAGNAFQPEQHRVFVLYEVNGTTYQGGLGSHFDLRVGEQVQIHYDPNNPGGMILRGDEALSPAWIPVLLGAGLLLAACFYGRRKKQEE